jgi:hypothetical protein
MVICRKHGQIGGGKKKVPSKIITISSVNGFAGTNTSLLTQGK